MTKKITGPYHRMKHPEGPPSAKAVQMQIDLESRFRRALAGTLSGQEYMLKLAEILEGFADEQVTADLEWFCLNHPQPFGSRITRLGWLADELFWWMRRHDLSGVADALERDLRQASVVAQQLDSCKPAPPGLVKSTAGPDPKPETMYARHVPLNGELRKIASRLRQVASEPAVTPQNVLNGSPPGFDEPRAKARAVLTLAYSGRSRNRKRFRTACRQFYNKKPLPVEWLDLPDRERLSKTHYRLTRHMFARANGAGPPEEELQIRAYVLLAILHDSALEGTSPRIAEGIWPRDEKFARDAWQQMEDNWHLWHDHIDTLLDLVRADLAQGERLRERLLPLSDETIATLIDLFRELQELCESEPHKEGVLWQECQEEARAELRQEEAERWRASVAASAASAHSSEPGEPRELDEWRVNLRAIEKYRQADGDYVKAWDKLQGRAAGFVKEIDHALFHVQDLFLNGPRNERTLLLLNWAEIRSQSPACLTADMLNHHHDGRIAWTIDALELYLSEYRSAYKRAFERCSQETKARAEAGHKTLSSMVPDVAAFDEQPVQDLSFALLGQARIAARHAIKNNFSPGDREEVKRLFRYEYDGALFGIGVFLKGLELTQDDRNHHHRKFEDLFRRIQQLLHESLDTNVLDHGKFNELDAELIDARHGLAFEAETLLEATVDRGKSVVVRSATDGSMPDSASDTPAREAFIPFNKAIELSNGVLTRRRLEKAIDKGDPVKVRDHRPRKQRRNVHIQDVLCLIEKLSANENVSAQIAEGLDEYRKQLLAKQAQPDLR